MSAALACRTRNGFEYDAQDVCELANILFEDWSKTELREFLASWIHVLWGVMMVEVCATFSIWLILMRRCAKGANKQNSCRQLLRVLHDDFAVIRDWISQGIVPERSVLYDTLLDVYEELQKHEPNKYKWTVRRLKLESYRTGRQRNYVIPAWVMELLNQLVTLEADAREYLEYVEDKVVFQPAIPKDPLMRDFNFLDTFRELDHMTDGHASKFANACLPQLGDISVMSRENLHLACLRQVNGYATNEMNRRDPPSTWMPHYQEILMAAVREICRGHVQILRNFQH